MTLCTPPACQCLLSCNTPQDINKVSPLFTNLCATLAASLHAVLCITQGCCRYPPFWQKRKGIIWAPVDSYIESR